MSRTCFVSFAAAMQIASSAAVAALPGEGVVAFGVGGLGCGEYIQNRRTPNADYDAEIIEWAYGFVSAHNFYAAGPQVKRDLPGSTILAYLDKYCRESPLATTGLGLTKLIATYAKP